jgi:hypothetical protein
MFQLKCNNKKRAQRSFHLGPDLRDSDRGLIKPEGESTYFEAFVSLKSQKKNSLYF